MCLFSHNWYSSPKGTMTYCGQEGQYLKLPGEVVIDGNHHDGCKYRLERHCLDCLRDEYWDRDAQKWKQVFRYETK